MLNQTFSLLDLPRLLTLTFLEAVLSVDNALVLALIIKNLPLKEQKKGLFIGLISAFVLRALGILLAAYLIGIFWVQILGGVYLLSLALSHLLRKKEVKSTSIKTSPPLWKVILLVECTDFVFAIDSILAGVALIGLHFTPPQLPPKIWIVYFGAMMGIILMRFAARLFSKWLKQFPFLEKGAHLIVGWIGIKLIFEATFYLIFKNQTPLSSPIERIFWAGVVLFLLIGIISVYGKKK
jgi:YkoY family integral membrane protein